MKRKKVQPRTEQQKNTAADKALQRKYGITLAEYNEQLNRQGGVCAICSRPPGTKRLHLDHTHSFASKTSPHRKEIVCRKLGPKRWEATVTGHPSVSWQGETKPAVLAGARWFVKRLSVRGILCFPCNRGLRVWNDKPDVMRSAAEYLERFANK